MTDLMTRVKPELGKETPPKKRPVAKGRIIAVALIAVMAGGAALLATAGPSAKELADAHWQQVVGYYEQQYQTVEPASSTEAGHWPAVIDYFEQQYQATNRAETARSQAVGDFFDQLSAINTDDAEVRSQAVGDYFDQLNAINTAEAEGAQGQTVTDRITQQLLSEQQ